MSPSPDALDAIRRRPTVTLPEAAAALGISRETAYRWARDGVLPGVLRLGARSVRLRTADLLAVLEPANSATDPSDNRSSNSPVTCDCHTDRP